jgi:hypothetical protein
MLCTCEEVMEERAFARGAARAQEHADFLGEARREKAGRRFYCAGVEKRTSEGATGLRDQRAFSQRKLTQCVSDT